MLCGCVLLWQCVLLWVSVEAFEKVFWFKFKVK